MDKEDIEELEKEFHDVLTSKDENTVSVFFTLDMRKIKKRLSKCLDIATLVTLAVASYIIVKGSK